MYLDFPHKFQSSTTVKHDLRFASPQIQGLREGQRLDDPKKKRSIHFCHINLTTQSILAFSKTKEPKFTWNPLVSTEMEGESWLGQSALKSLKPWIKMFTAASTVSITSSRSSFNDKFSKYSPTNRSSEQNFFHVF